jgi:RimJ/RimL family protein N-acetyltransferase
MPPPPTARLEFRVWRASDVELAAKLWGDARVMRFIGGPYSDEEVRARIEREVANDAAFGIQYWPVFVDGAFAGACGLKPHATEPGHHFREIGFQFLPEFWGAGYASEAARAVIAYAFGTLDATALFAGHHPENETSRALLIRLGFTQIGTHYFARTALQHPWYRLDRPERAAVGGLTKGVGEVGGGQGRSGY